MGRGWKKKVMRMKCRVSINTTIKNIFRLYKILLIKLTGLCLIFIFDMIAIVVFYAYEICFNVHFVCSQLSFYLAVHSLPRHTRLLMFSLRSWRLWIWHNLWKLIVRWNHVTTLNLWYSKLSFYLLDLEVKPCHNSQPLILKVVYFICSFVFSRALFSLVYCSFDVEF